MTIVETSGRQRVLRAVRRAAVAGLALAVAASIPFLWTRIASAGHRYDEADLAATSSPRADVALVLGAEVEPNNAGPKAVLRGRLDTAAQLLRDGRVKVILVSGDGNGRSGDETGVMSLYLSRTWGIAPSRVLIDPYGLDTYDSCIRARQVYGITKALVVTQPFHLGRAVALCRHVGIDADGVGARCDCTTLTVTRNAARDYLACTKAAWDALSGREPAVQSPPSAVVRDALAAA